MNAFSLDHVNIRTSNLQRLITFYQDIIGLRLGERPAFSFNGAWLYSGNCAIVHLVEALDLKQPVEPKNLLTLEHFALRGESDDLADFLAHLRHHRVPYRVGILPGLAICQINIRDPDGNRLHIDFANNGSVDLTDYAGNDRTIVNKN